MLLNSLTVILGGVDFCDSVLSFFSKSFCQAFQIFNPCFLSTNFLYFGSFCKNFSLNLLIVPINSFGGRFWSSSLSLYVAKSFWLKARLGSRLANQTLNFLSFVLLKSLSISLSNGLSLGYISFHASCTFSHASLSFISRLKIPKVSSSSSSLNQEKGLGSILNN